VYICHNKSTKKESRLTAELIYCANIQINFDFIIFACMKEIIEPSRHIPVRDEVDVLVVGGGPAGLMAAQAAALVEGTKVMLIENRGSMGGNMTQGLPLLGFLGRKGNVIIKGLRLRFV
jgi:NADPH-dependent 2,4-dienoyl-CoA reductase/sulfur reductase-like enzyme